MLKEILYKWFGLEEPPCASCEILRAQLEKCDDERRKLLSRLLDGEKEAPVETPKNFQPIVPRFVPWRVRQQILEAEDRAAAETLKKKQIEIENFRRIGSLEKELGVEDALESGNEQVEER